MHLYTRRDARLRGDCAGDPDAARPAAPCGVQNLHYTYDPVGNITHIQDDAQDTIWFANQQVEPSSDYAYDALYRLIEATGRENAAAIGAPPHAEGDWPTGQFPSAGGDAQLHAALPLRQRRQHPVRAAHRARLAWPTRRRLDARLRLRVQRSATSRRATASGRPGTAATAANAVTYRHDAHGNMLNLAETAPGLDVRWDWRDMIRALDLGGGGDAFYHYGIDKQRTRKRIERNGGGSEDRIYLGGYELYRRRNAAGAVVEEIESHHLFEGEQRVLLVDDVLRRAPQRPAGPERSRVERADAVPLPVRQPPRLGRRSSSTTAAQVISYEEFHPYGTSAYRLLDVGHRGAGQAIPVHRDGAGRGERAELSRRAILRTLARAVDELRCRIE